MHSRRSGVVAATTASSRHNHNRGRAFDERDEELIKKVVTKPRRRKVIKITITPSRLMELFLIVLLGWFVYDNYRNDKRTESSSLDEKGEAASLGFSKALQTKGTLGQRMENAFSSAFEQGYKKVLIVGSDLYSLKASHIEKALEQLDKKEVVIGPAQDGGYYLLGLNKKLPALFCNKNWGTSSVLKETLKDLRTKSVALMEPLNDVDDFEDLKKETELLKKLNIDVKTYQRNC